MRKITEESVDAFVRVRYKTRKEVDEFAESRGATVQWDYYGHGHHRVAVGVEPYEIFGCFNTNEAWDDIEAYS
tara:strand:- start:2028 stop:2246 length:219 start_codon:yes stop_codon:yes gene_type:complete